MMRILIVDDEDSVRTLLRVVLEQGGYEVVVAATADTAVALYEKCPADLVITDIFLPDADAPAKMLELVRRHPDIKVIAVSGAASQDATLAIAKLMGARRIIQKPFSIHELLEEVRAQLAASPQKHKESPRLSSQSPMTEFSHPVLPQAD
jgi:two-component system response regulator (stage 0 sporulation protein F)